jgi:hypothetical protein
MEKVIKMEAEHQVYMVRYHEYKALCAYCRGLISSKLICSEDAYNCSGHKRVMNHPYYKVRCSYSECVRFKHLGSECSKCADCSGCHKR